MKRKKITYLILSGLLANTLLSAVPVEAVKSINSGDTGTNKALTEESKDATRILTENSSEAVTNNSIEPTVIENESELTLVEYVEAYLQAVSYDEIIKQYGGRLTMEQAYSSEQMRLRELQVGDNRSMDSLQLEETFLQVKGNAKEAAEKIVRPFDENEAVEKTLKERLNEVVFYYVYTQRWFNYEIGETAVADVMFGQLDIFADHNETNFEMLVNILDTLSYDPWPNVPGKPMAMAYFMHHLFFESYGMQGTNKGFSREELKNEDGKYSMVSLIEFLIDTYGEGISYDQWLSELGFIMAEPSVSETVEMEQANYSLWMLLKNAEFVHANSVTPAFATILFSVPEKEKILLTGSTNYVVVGNATKYDSVNPKDPQEVVNRYERTLSTIMQFFWENGTDEVKESLDKDKKASYVFDAGEWEAGGLKDVHSTDSPYLHYLMQAASPSNTAVNITTTAHNATVAQNNILFSLGNMYNEYTFAHEVEHTIRPKIYAGDTRMHSENSATLLEADCLVKGNLTLNVAYNDTEYGVWNQRATENPQELRNYADNILDLIFALNYVKAKEVFSLPLEEQVGHVQRMKYSSGEVVAEWLTLEELKELNLQPEDDQFIEKMIAHKLFLPSKYDASLSNDNAPFVSGDYPAHVSLGLRRDAYFYVPYTGDNLMTGYNANSAYGFNHYWWFESLSVDGWASVVTFNAARFDNDLLALNAVGISSPEQRTIDRYNNVKEKLANNQLALDTEEELRTLFQANLKNDGKMRDEIITKYQKNAEEIMFHSIFTDVTEEILAPHVGDVYEGDTQIIVENRSEGTIKIETAEGILIGQSEDEQTGEVAVYITPQQAGQKLFVYTVNKQEQSSEKTEVIVQEKEDIETQFTIDEYTYGQINITGTFSDNIKRARLKINDKIVSWGGDFKNNQFTYYVGAGRITEQDTAVLEALDEKDQVIATMPIHPVKQETGVVKANYTLGNQTIVGIASKETKRARLIVNGTVISQGGAFSGENFSYYVNPNSIREGDQVLLQGYDSQDRPLGMPIEIDIQKNIGELTSVHYDAKTNTITGEYTGTITRARLTVDGEVISWGGTFKEGQFSYYVSASVLVNHKEAYLEIFDNGNNLISQEKYYISE
ncbi:immunoglobulin-like domain-containing protein [Enterococcus rotai]|uniref:immunoglobulin-like domain-containing protein n=1 Tax=Enterococcus rotai TaxID=118060 RepID=UPI0032B4FA36